MLSQCVSAMSAHRTANLQKVEFKLAGDFRTFTVGAGPFGGKDRERPRVEVRGHSGRLNSLD